MDEEDLPLSINVAQDCAHLTLDESAVRVAIERVLGRFGRREARISVAVVDDARIAKLNGRFLDHSGPTDCITFDLSDSVEGCIEGEVVISGETAAREAATRGLAPRAEALLYVVHGTLHLLGLDDSTEQESDAMHAIEDQVLTEIGIGPAYAVGRA